MIRKIVAVWVSLVMLFGFVVIVDVVTDITPPVKAATITVDDSGGADYLTIQEGIDAANPGDTVFVYNGTYNENVVVNKAINLTGEDRNTTIIDGGGSGIVVSIETDFINMSHLRIQNGTNEALSMIGINNYTCRNMTVLGKDTTSDMDGYRGFWIEGCSGILIYNSFIKGGKGGDAISMGGFGSDGIWAESSDNISIINCVVQGGDGGNSTDDEGGFGGWAIYLHMCNGSYIAGNNVSGGNGGMGFFGVRSSPGHAIAHGQGQGLIENNYCYESWAGIVIWWSSSSIIRKNVCVNNEEGIGFHSGASPYIVDNIFSDNYYGIYGYNDGNGGTATPTIINCTVINSSKKDLSLGGTHSHPILINTTFNKEKVGIVHSSLLTVQWFLTAKILNISSNPVEDATVVINDSYGSNAHTINSDANGEVTNMIITEYVQDSTSMTYYTPHYISAYYGLLFGDIIPNQTIDTNREFIIILGKTSLYLNLEFGWNLISIPLDNINSSLPETFISINGDYKAVSWYNISYINGPWKHYNNLKPQYLNDLNVIDRGMGLWIYIINPEGTNLIISGEKLTSELHINANIGWNMVGYPSLSNRSRDNALNNINYGSDVDSIWTFNAATQTWQEIGPSDYFELGRGYWIHSKVTKVWDVPL